MKKILLGIMIASAMCGTTFATTTSLTNSENGHGYKVLKVVLDGNSKIVVNAVPNKSPAQSLKTLMLEAGWSYAINWWFFCPDEKEYSRCKPNTSDLVRKENGILYSTRSTDIGSQKSVFGFDTTWLPLFVSDNGGYELDTDVDLVHNGIWMPTLVKAWLNVAVNNEAMNSDPKQWAVGNKSFICSTQDKSTIYMWYIDGVTFSSLADYLIQTFKCHNAIQLDNWWSKAMIANKNYVEWPWRDIMDAYVIIEGSNVWPVVIPDIEKYSVRDLQAAITRMYSKGLTKYDTIATFMPFSNMTREEASKFFGVFASWEFLKTEYPNNMCDFTDIKSADWSLVPNIVSSCKLGLFKWSQWNFIPKDKLTTAQAIAVLIRIMVGTLDETTTPWYTSYITKAKEFELIGNLIPETNISRWQAAILLYKAHLYREAHSNIVIPDEKK